MLVKQITLQPLRPAFRPDLAVERTCRLPYGGPYGVGGKFAKGTVLGCVAGTVQSEVRTLTVGTTTGTITSTFTADKPYVVSHQHNDPLAAVQALWEGVFGKGNVAVTGTPGTNYVLTFQGRLANARIGGLLSLSVAAGTASWARTTAGSAGAGQFDRYLDAGTNNAPTTARSVLAYDYLSDPQGGLALDAGSPNQSYSPQHYVSGYFLAADLAGMDAAAMADPGFRFVEGTALADGGAVVGLGV
jgi:hypothetical protein